VSKKCIGSVCNNFEVGYLFSAIMSGRMVEKNGYDSLIFFLLCLLYKFHNKHTVSDVRAPSILSPRSG